MKKLAQHINEALSLKTVNEAKTITSEEFCKAIEKEFSWNTDNGLTADDVKCQELEQKYFEYYIKVKSNESKVFRYIGAAGSTLVNDFKTFIKKLTGSAPIQIVRGDKGRNTSHDYYFEISNELIK